MANRISVSAEAYANLYYSRQLPIFQAYKQLFTCCLPTQAAECNSSIKGIYIINYLLIIIFYSLYLLFMQLTREVRALLLTLHFYPLLAMSAPLLAGYTLGWAATP